MSILIIVLCAALGATPEDRDAQIQAALATLDTSGVAEGNAAAHDALALLESLDHSAYCEGLLHAARNSRLMEDRESALSFVGRILDEGCKISKDVLTVMRSLVAVEVGMCDTGLKLSETAVSTQGDPKIREVVEGIELACGKSVPDEEVVRAVMDRRFQSVVGAAPDFGIFAADLVRYDLMRSAGRGREGSSYLKDGIDDLCSIDQVWPTVLEFCQGGKESCLLSEMFGFLRSLEVWKLYEDVGDHNRRCLADIVRALESDAVQRDAGDDLMFVRRIEDLLKAR